MPDLTLDLRAVQKRFREGDAEREVLRGVDLQLERGRFGVLVGRSGEGKSTLLNVIAGMEQPDGGTVEVAGQRLDGRSDRERTLFRRRHVGFIFQHYNLVPTLTVGENVRFLLDLNGVPAAEAERRAMGLLDAVGLADRAGAFPDRLSGGEQQRVSVARALAHEPDLVLADEPTGDLDAENGQRVLDLLEQLAREHGRTLLVVTHDAAPLTRADIVFRLSAGQVEVEGVGLKGEGEMGRRGEERMEREEGERT